MVYGGISPITLTLNELRSLFGAMSQPMTYVLYKEFGEVERHDCCK